MTEDPPGPMEGLTASEVAERLADGRANQVPTAPTRTTGQIIRANLLTPVNLVIGTLLVLVVAARGISPDMLFGGVIVSNSIIGIVQEVRARAALNRLAVLNQPRAVAIRDGAEVDLEVHLVVEDDLLVLAPGDQTVVDGTLVESKDLELNEALLTGEADPAPKQPGDEVLAGSFVVSGSGTYRAVRVGADSYASTLAEEARRFALVNSELRRGVDRILKLLMVVIPPVAMLLGLRLLQAGDGWREALVGVVAASVAMVPDGLVLLTSLAFMVGVIRLARHEALIGELAAVELLARVDVLCLDKTGTLTTGRIAVTETIALSDAPVPVRDLLAAFGASDPNPNATQAAIGEAFRRLPGWTVTDTVRFSSARKWSAAAFSGPGLPDGGLALYVGAPEFLLGSSHPEVAQRVSTLAGDGHRVLLAALAPSLRGDGVLEDLTPVALVLLDDEIRGDAAQTLRRFRDEGVTIKVISGDHPATAAAVARRAGVECPERGFDARDLPDNAVPLAAALSRHSVFGRVTPRQKTDMVRALQSQGHVVAMVGDGVNDVLALKDADMGITMGSGSTASRAVAQLVLVGDRFSALPHVLTEGRRVMNTVERASNLFIYGTVYAVLVSLAIVATGADFPFLPRHLTLVRVLTVGIPGFVLAVAPDPRKVRPGFLGRVARFSLPAGGIAGSAALVVYFLARADASTDLAQARTAATMVLLGIGLGLLVRLTRTLPAWRWGLVAAMALSAVGSLLVEPVAHFFGLVLPGTATSLALVAVLAAALVAVRFVPVDSDPPDRPKLVRAIAGG